MDLLDLVIVVLLVAAIASGWRRGLTWVGFSFLGLILGVVIGAAIAPPIAHRFGDHVPSTEALIGTGVFLACVATLQGIGTAIGYRIRVAALRTDLAEVDSGLGAGLAAIGVLVVTWYLGLTFVNFKQFSSLAVQIRNSAILRVLDHIAPRPPAFLAQLEQLLRGEAFPNPFAALSPQQFGDTALPTPVQLQTPGVAKAEAATSKVLSSGCGLEAGSAWPVSPDHWVTNAHVVAGGQSIQIIVPGHDAVTATVVLFDPETDLAVLYATGTGVQPLTVAGDDPAPGTQGAVIGYPRGGDRQTVVAGVKGVETAEGYDIYGSNRVERKIEVLKADIIPGNSGGPIVNLSGTVIGVVFAASTTDPQEGYALAPSTVSRDITAARNLTQPVGTQDCAN